MVQIAIDIENEGVKVVWANVKGGIRASMILMGIEMAKKALLDSMGSLE